MSLAASPHRSAEGLRPSGPKWPFLLILTAPLTTSLAPFSVSRASRQKGFPAKLWSAAACCRFFASQLAGGHHFIPTDRTGIGVLSGPASKLAGRKAAASCRTPKLRTPIPTVGRVRRDNHRKGLRPRDSGAALQTTCENSGLGLASPQSKRRGRRSSLYSHLLFWGTSVAPALKPRTYNPAHAR